MTEAEWRECDDPTEMLVAASEVRTERKLRLLLTHSARSARDPLTPPVLGEAVEVAEQFAEGEASPDALDEVGLRVANLGLVRPSPEELLWRRDDARGTRGAYCCLVATSVTPAGGLSHPERLLAWYGAAQAARDQMPGLFRELFGPLPFRPIAFSPAWRTDTAVVLARQMYDSREFSAMPILADALQDAGCDSEEILSHCRDASATHVRGCWVVDLVLGKE